MRTLRRLIPRAVRSRAAGPVGQLQGARIRRRLAALAASGRPILAGPWLGEVGFELLYWAPFLRWFASEYGVVRERLTVLSRGGTSSWYEPAAAHYEEVFEHVTPDVFRQWHAERYDEIGEQKQTRVTCRDRELLDRVLASRPAGTQVLHPSLMYALMNPFWWRHLDEGWIHRHARYRQFARPPRPPIVELPERYVAIKFYFNDCFPRTDENAAFVHDLVSREAKRGAVVLLSTGIPVDDHDAVTVPGVRDISAATHATDNLHVQSAVVAHASAFIGTYGGFAYLAPFHGVPSISCFSHADGFSRAHLHMARSAFTSIGAGDLLHVRSITEGMPEQVR